MAEAQYHDPALAAFYDWDCPWGPDHDWFASLIKGAGSVLDLGCGTGMFTVALAAQGIKAVGVDPAGAMLDIARARCEISGGCSPGTGLGCNCQTPAEDPQG